MCAPSREPCGTSPLTCICWHDELMCVGCEDGSIVIWYPLTRCEVFCLRGHQQQVTGLSSHTQVQALASCSVDGTVRLWDTKTRQSKELRVHDGPIHQILSSPATARRTSALFVTCSADCTVRSVGADCTAANGNQLAVICTLDQEVTAMSFLTAYILFLGVHKGFVAELDLWSGKIMRHFSAFSGRVASLIVDSTGHRVISGSAEGHICVWDLADDRVLDQRMLQEGGICSIALAKDVRKPSWAARDVLLGSRSGILLRLGDLSRSDTGPPQYDIVQQYSVAAVGLRALLVDLHGELWVACQDNHLAHMTPSRVCEFCDLACVQPPRSNRPRDCRGACRDCEKPLGFGQDRKMGRCSVCRLGPAPRRQEPEPKKEMIKLPLVEVIQETITVATTPESSPVHVHTAPQEAPASSARDVRRCGGGFTAGSKPRRLHSIGTGESGRRSCESPASGRQQVSSNALQVSTHLRRSANLRNGRPNSSSPHPR